MSPEELAADRAAEEAWIDEQVAAMPTPSRRDAQVWAALLDIKALFNTESAA